MAYGDAIAALADPTRRAVFERLRRGPKPVVEIARGLPVSRPAVSQHLRVLKHAGLVRERREGTRHFYSVNGDGLTDLREYFEEFWDEALAAFKQAAETKKGDTMGPQQTTEMVLTKTITVGLPVDDAFRLYTEEMGSWWPFGTHSIGEQEVETVVFEPRDGGRIYERTKDGGERDWGSVVGWDPPRRLAHTWHLSRPEELAQHVEVRFEAEGSDTRVELVHTGWEKLGDRAAESFASYDSGWDYVLGKYVGQGRA
jgi:DNA-binding transcriptional ArsR family regulator/uncharacterized protein YndB with AHSA1/START domain